MEQASASSNDSSILCDPLEKWKVKILLAAVY